MQKMKTGHRISYFYHLDIIPKYIVLCYYNILYKYALFVFMESALLSRVSL